MSIREFYTFDNIGSYDGNVHIIHGDKDDIVNYSYSQTAVETYPNADLTILEGEGHGFTPAGGQKAMKEMLAFFNENIQ